MSDIGLPHEGNRLRVLDRRQSFQRRPALGLRFQSQPQIRFELTEKFAIRRLSRQLVEDTVECVGLRNKQRLGPSQISVACQLTLRAKVIYQRVDGRFAETFMEVH
jgi:hypothetical protein